MQKSTYPLVRRKTFESFKIASLSKALLFFLIFIFSSSTAYLQVTWTGTVDSDWATAGNWDIGVPTATDNVTISDVTTNDPVINNGTMAVAQRVIIQSGGFLLVETGANLTIGNSPSAGIVSAGTLINEGNITINNSSSNGFQQGATGSFENNGTISINNSGFRGIENNSLMTNSGILIIDGTQEAGLDNGLDDTFENTGTITISNVLPSDRSIANKGSIINQGCASFISSDNEIVTFSGNFDNEGLIVENASRNSNITNNTGIVQNLNGGTFNVGSGNAPITSANPTAICQNWDVVLDANGNASLDPADIDNGSINNSDACGGGLTLSVAPNTFDCTNLGNNPVTLTVEDAAGNSATCTATLLVFGDLDQDGVCDAEDDCLLVQNNVPNLDLNTCECETSYVPTLESLFPDGPLILTACTFTCPTGVGHEWTGCISSDWEDPQNWLAGTVPSANDEVTIPDVTTNDPVIGSGTLAEAESVLIENDASLDINGDLTIDGSTADGLENKGMLTISGVLNIDNTTGSGLVASSNSTVDNTTGTINIGQNGLIGGNGIVLMGSFANSGFINIDDVVESGIRTSGSNADFFNTGNIFIGQNGIANNGILVLNNSSFTNQSALIRIDGVTNDGISVLGGSMFKNDFRAARLIIAEMGGFSGQSIGTSGAGSVFENSGCARVLIFDQMNYANGGAIINNGFFTINTSEFHTSNGGTFTNNDVLEIIQLPLVPNLTNNDMLIAPVSSACEEVTSVLGLGSSNDYIANSTWYSDASLMTVAGTYDQNTNTYTSTDGVMGIQTLYFTTNNSGCFKNVSIEVDLQADGTPPVAQCQDAIAQLDAMGNASITAAEIDNGSTDNCGITNMTVSQSSFDCDDEGINNSVTVTLTVEDASGNTSTCTANVEVDDKIDPMAGCKDITVQLDANGLATINANDVEDGSTDNCGVTIPVSVTPNQFSCVDVGTVQVTLLVGDGNENQNTCIANVDVKPDVDDNCPLTDDSFVGCNVVNTLKPYDYLFNLRNPCFNGEFTLLVYPRGGTLKLPENTTVIVEDDNGNSYTLTTDILGEAEYQISPDAIDASMAVTGIAFGACSFDFDVPFSTNGSITPPAAVNCWDDYVLNEQCQFENIGVEPDSDDNCPLTDDSVDANCNVVNTLKPYDYLFNLRNPCFNGEFTLLVYPRGNTEKLPENTTIIVEDDNGNSYTLTTDILGEAEYQISTDMIDASMAVTSVSFGVCSFDFDVPFSTNGSITPPAAVNCWDDYVLNEQCQFENIGVEPDSDDNCPLTDDSVDANCNVVNTLKPYDYLFNLRNPCFNGEFTLLVYPRGNTEKLPENTTIIVEDDNGNSYTLTTDILGEAEYQISTDMIDASMAVTSVSFGVCSFDFDVPFSTNGSITPPAAVNCWDDYVLNEQCQFENVGVEPDSDDNCPLTDDSVDSDCNVVNTLKPYDYLFQLTNPCFNGEFVLNVLPRGGTLALPENTTVTVEDDNGNVYTLTTDVNGYAIFSLAPGLVDLSLEVTSIAFGGCSFDLTIPFNPGNTQIFPPPVVNPWDDFQLNDNCEFVNVGVPGYCISNGNSTYYEWIKKVKFAGIDNLSGNNNGYADFTGMTAFVDKGNSYSIQLKPGYSSWSASERWRVWIDFNQDGDFDDWGERVLSKTKTGTVNATIHIPSSALSGQTRMRVSMKYGWYQGPCQVFSHGEVEDYTIDISSCDNVTDGGQISGDELLCGGADDPAEITSAADASGGSGGAIEYLWLENTTTSTPPTTSNMNGWVAIPNSDAPTYDPGVITTTTWYIRCARRNGCTIFAGESNVVEKTVQASCSGPSYCTSQGQSTYYEWIKKVKIGSINHLSGDNGGYADFTNMSTDVSPGQSKTITLKPGGTGGTKRWRVWIDWNQDGDFNDSGEKEVQAIVNGNFSRTFTVPANAALGTTRMRVSMKYGSYPTPCQTFGYGEVEDYTINVVSGAGNRQRNDQLQLVAIQQLNEVDLTWTNNTGFKNDLFVIEKSMDGENFEPINEQTSLSSDQSEVYKGKDESPESGANFYRIKLELNDNTTMYSNMQEVQITLDTDDFTVFPNPAAYQVYVSMKELAGKPGSITMSNQMGRVIFERSFESIPTHAERIDLKDYSAGVYFITVKAEGRRMMTKRVVVIDEN